MKNIIKKILAIWISIYLIVVPPFAHAASTGGWSFSAFDVASSVVTAVKNGASASVAVAKSPITSKIAKGIVGGAIAGAAIPLAISQLTGIALNAVDWVLDPANNAIRVKVPNSAIGTQKFKIVPYWERDLYYPIGITSGYATPVDACRAHNAGTFVSISNGKVNCTGGSVNSLIIPDDYNYKTIPIPTIADKIYDNAKTDSASKSIVNDAVKDYINEGSADVALDAAKADADATHNCGTGTSWNGSACVATPSTPSTPSTPDTPFDPSSIIDAIKGVFDAVMSLPDVINSALDDLLADIKDFFQPLIDALKSLIEKLTEFFDAIIAKFDDFVDWVKTTYDEFVKPNDSPTDVDVNVPQTPSIDTDINFGGSCPANVTGSFVIGGRTTTFNIMDWSQFCLIMSTYLKPLVIALASYQAVKILAGRNESN